MTARRRGARGRTLGRFFIWFFSIVALTPVVTHLALKYTSFWRGKNPILGHVARAAQGRVLRMLASPEGPWVDAAAGRPLPGYRDDTDYGDVPGGLYKVMIASGPAAGQVTARVRAWNSFSGDSRIIEAVYSRAWRSPGALIVEGPFTLSNDFHVHWGPIYVHGDLTVSTFPSLTGWPQNGNGFFPRKFATGVVTP